MKLTDDQYTKLICRLENHETAVRIFVQSDNTGTERAAQRSSTIAYINGLIDGLLMLDVDTDEIDRISPRMLDVVNSIDQT